MIVQAKITAATGSDRARHPLWQMRSVVERQKVLVPAERCHLKLEKECHE
jgi:hypothetical protein